MGLRSAPQSSVKRAGAIPTDQWSCWADHDAFIPTCAIPPIMLELVIGAQYDNLQVHSPRAFAQAGHGCYIVAEVGTVPPATVTASGIPAPPMLNTSADSHAEFEIAVGAKLVLHAILALYH